MEEDNNRSGILDRIFKKRKQTEEAAEQEITFSLRKVADSSTVTMGATEIMGITRYEGANLSARNSTSWPPAPSSPTPMLRATDLGRTSSLKLILASAKMAQGIMERAHTTYTISEGNSLGMPR